MAGQRVRRPAEERALEVEKKIKDHKEVIKKLEEKREAILHPKAKRKKGAVALKAIVDKAKESGMTVDEIAAKLGISIDD